MMGPILDKAGIEWQYATTRLEMRESLIKEIEEYKPTHVLNCAGVTGRPNVDWCEFNKDKTIRANIIGGLNLIDVCSMHDIHCTTMATGCIFEYDDKHPLGSGIGFTEDELPNFTDSWYSKTKGFFEQMARSYDNSCILRLRMPLSDDLSPRNFITKISKYEKVVNIPNSMSVLSDLLPTIPGFMARGLTGVWNFTNPGVISHNEVLDLYTKYIDPDFKYQNFTLEQQNKILAAGRSNNELDATKLIKAFPQIEHIKPAMEKLFQRMKKNLDAQGWKPTPRPKPKA